MGYYVYRPDDEERMAGFLRRAKEFGKFSVRFAMRGNERAAGDAARHATRNARQYMMLRAVTGRD